MDISIASFEYTILSVIRCVELAADTIIDVLAEMTGIWPRWVANFEAELIGAHEVVPFNNLGVRLAPCPEVGPDGTAQRVATEISTMGVHLTTGVTVDQVDHPLLDESDDLNVITCLHELHAGESTAGDHTGSMSWLSAPGDHLAFHIENFGIWHSRSPETKIGNAVKVRILAVGLLVLSSRVAHIKTELRPSYEVGISIYFVG